MASKVRTNTSLVSAGWSMSKGRPSNSCTSFDAADDADERRAAAKAVRSRNPSPLSSIPSKSACHRTSSGERL
jgi:hypothetical protein